MTAALRDNALDRLLRRRGVHRAAFRYMAWSVTVTADYKVAADD
jgi:hypothetical protein